MLNTYNTMNDQIWNSFCITAFFIVFIAIIGFFIISFKKYRSINKGDKSAIRGGFILSIVFLLIFGSVTIYLILEVLDFEMLSFFMPNHSIMCK